MNNAHNLVDADEPDVQELLNADRELDPHEQQILRDYAKREWQQLPSVASGILLERQRLAELWTEVEKASGDTYIAKMERFRAALGLS